MKMVFVDASAWIALYHKRDKYHQPAWVIYEQSLNEARKFLTSNWVAYALRLGLFILNSALTSPALERCFFKSSIINPNASLLLVVFSFDLPAMPLDGLLGRMSSCLGLVTMIIRPSFVVHSRRVSESSLTWTFISKLRPPLYGIVKQPLLSYSRT